MLRVWIGFVPNLEVIYALEQICVISAEVYTSIIDVEPARFFDVSDVLNELVEVIFD